MNDVSHFVHEPGGALRRFVREIIWIRSDRPRRQVLLPETTLTLALRQAGSALLQARYAAGEITSEEYEERRTKLLRDVNAK